MYSSMCTYNGCDDKVVAKGLCSGHYKQTLRGQELAPKRSKQPKGFAKSAYVPRPKKPKVPCVVGYCQRDTRAMTMCSSHYGISKRFGFTVEQLVEFYLGGKCEVCATTQDLHIDHDHSCCPGSTTCGKCVRGLLCRACNLALGYMRDDPEHIAQLLAYVKRQST